MISVIFIFYKLYLLQIKLSITMDWGTDMMFIECYQLNIDWCSFYHDFQLQHCIGSAVIAMGPERILTLLPISFHADDFTCSNIWLIPILKNYVVEASLGYYMEHIVPLAKSFQRACRKGIPWKHMKIIFLQVSTSIRTQVLRNLNSWENEDAYFLFNLDALSCQRHCLDKLMRGKYAACFLQLSDVY